MSSIRSASNYSFANLPKVDIQRSAFKRDRTLKSAFNAGYLVPFYWDEVYPGDTFNVKSTVFGRLATPIAPFMDNLYMDVFYFYCPYRILWKNWNKMLGEQDNPDDSTDYLTPILASAENMATPRVTSIESQSLLDYLGFPVGTFNRGTNTGLEINSFLCRAYNKIWNDHFRDENLQDSVYFDDGDGPDLVSNFTLLRRGKRKDYFTSCLPWPQKGPGAEVSIGGTAPVFGDGNSLTLFDGSLAYVASSSHGSSPTDDLVFGKHNAGSPMHVGIGTQTISPAVHKGIGVPTKEQFGTVSNLGGTSTSGLLADLSDVSPFSVNDLRMAFQLQRWMEKSARSGTRAPEIILGHFGVVCPDFRLQRSEYLGGGEVPIQVHQVVQTSGTGSVVSEVENTPQGNVSGYGVLSGRVGFSKSFVEHGVVLGLVSVRADLNYQQGLERSWSRRGKFDYYWPTLAHLGEQAVLNKEIFASGDETQDNAAFGYQERWAELRYGISHITGQLRSEIGQSLDYWHLAQHFDELPRLNASFIEDNPPIARVLALSDEAFPQIIFDSLTQCSCVRPMPMYSVPGLIDHF